MLKNFVVSFNVGELARVNILVEFSRRIEHGQGPVPFVYLDPEHNVNFDPIRPPRVGKINTLHVVRDIEL